MTSTYELSMDDIRRFAHLVAEQLPSSGGALECIPRGGFFAAAMIAAETKGHWRLEEPGQAVREPTYLVDDILATGATARRYYRPHHSGLAVLVSRASDTVREDLKRRNIELTVGATVATDDGWVVFPWERGEALGPDDAVRRLIEYSGDDPMRSGLLDTPRRVLAMYDELRERREERIALTAFEVEYDDLMVVKNIPLASLCEHHMMPYTGHTHVGYIPDGSVLGLSKVARVVALLQSGLTMQETLTRSIAKEISGALGSPHVAVVTTASHTCMTVRGIRAHGSETTVSAMLGGFKEDSSLRSEFLQLLGV